MAASTELVPLSEYRALANGADAAALIRETLAGQEVSEFDLTRVRIPSGGATTFEVPSRIGDDVATKRLEGVILFDTKARAYWENPYSGGSEPPSCSSNDGEHAEPRETEEGGAPNIPATEDPDTGKLLCHTCRFNEYGTATREGGGKGKGKACRETRQVFLLTPGRMLPTVLVLPPTSIRPFSGYLLGLADEGVNWRNVVTAVTLIKKSGDGPDYSQAVFQPGEALDPTMAEQVAAYRAASEPTFMRYARETGVEEAAEAVASDAGAAA